jgi:hypothetical protein
MNLNRLKEIEKNIEIPIIYVIFTVIVVLIIWIGVLLSRGVIHILLENI